MSSIEMQVAILAELSAIRKLIESNTHGPGPLRIVGDNGPDIEAGCVPPELVASLKASLQSSSEIADQMEVASRLISAVVRDALNQKRKPSLHDVKCRALIAANTYVAGVIQINRAVLHAAPDRPVSK